MRGCPRHRQVLRARGHASRLLAKRGLIDLFEHAGYAPVTPGWPDDPATVEEARAHPEVFAGKSIGEVADHFEDVIRDPQPLDTDHTVPLSIVKSSFKHEKGQSGDDQDGRDDGPGTRTDDDDNWQGVAETALKFVGRFVS